MAGKDHGKSEPAISFGRIIHNRMNYLITIMNWFIVVIK